MQTTRRSLARGPRAALALALTCAPFASCMSFATGTSAPKPPDELGVDAPVVALSGDSTFTTTLRHAVAESGLFGGTVEDASSADLELLVSIQSDSELSTLGLFNVFLLGALPLPFEDVTRTYLARVRVGSLPEVALPPVRRTVHVWGGLPLILFFWVSVDESELRESTAREIVSRTAAAYADLHARTFDAATKSDDPAALERFVAAFPRSERANEARDELEQRLYAALDANAPASAYLRYLASFPNSPRSAEVRARGVEPAWREIAAAPDVERVEEFVHAFPGHALTAEALALLDDLLWKRAESAATNASYYTAYAERFPDGDHAAACADVLDWVRAERGGTQEAVETYLADRPDGRFAQHARRALEILADPARKAVAAEIPHRVDLAIHRNDTSSAIVGTAEYDGSLLSVEADMRIVVTYHAVVRNGAVVAYTLLTGSVTADDDLYVLAEDGTWNAGFPRTFR